ncbi:MAG: anti-sigma factor [Actinobacteria bacterium]|nr:anti-sigma factor [Actinomycetota bacterium]
MLASRRARDHTAAILNRAWEQSLEADRSVLCTEDRGEAVAEPFEGHDKSPFEESLDVAATSLEPAALDLPEPAHEPAPVSVGLVPPRFLESAPDIEPEPVADANFKPASAAGPSQEETPPNGTERRRRRRAVTAAVSAIACAAVAAGTASWALWANDDSSGPMGDVLAAISSNDAERIPLSGSSNRLAVVVGRNGQAALVSSMVRSAPQGKQYEIWVIRANKPVQAALFSGGPGRMVVPLSLPVRRGDTVAVTLEARGGVGAPTSPVLYAATRTAE